jgi:hypothetical protein
MSSDATLGDTQESPENHAEFSWLFLCMESGEFWPMHLLFVSLNLKYKEHAKTALDLTLCNLVNR